MFVNRKLSSDAPIYYQHEGNPCLISTQVIEGIKQIPPYTSSKILEIPLRIPRQPGHLMQIWAANFLRRDGRTPSFEFDEVLFSFLQTQS